MSLETFWFVLLGVLWAGFFVLEGFDFGVGMLSGAVGRDEPGRLAALRTIAPFWDGNEVWLIVATAGTFAAFPGWYATMISAYYPVVLLLLVALILRGISLEFRERSDAPRWRRTWAALLPVASLLIPFLIGLMLAGLLRGVPIDSDQEFTGGLLDLMQPYPVVAGITFVLLCLLHGATYLTLRTTGELRTRSRRWAETSAAAAGLGVLVFAFWTPHVAGGGWVPQPTEIAAVVLVVVGGVLVRGRRPGAAFTATAGAMAATVASLFIELHPRVMVSTTSGNDLTVSNTASGSYALTVMTWVAAVLVPLVLAYVVWTYAVLRARFTGGVTGVPRPRQPAPSEQAATSSEEASRPSR
jgi:cytochrome d ubiquinol oxidase subunit II